MKGDWLEQTETRAFEQGRSWGEIVPAAERVKGGNAKSFAIGMTPLPGMGCLTWRGGETIFEMKQAA